MIFVIVMAYLSLDAIINWVPRSLGSSTPDPKSQAKIHSRERKRERERERARDQLLGPAQTVEVSGRKTVPLHCCFRCSWDFIWNFTQPSNEHLTQHFELNPEVPKPPIKLSGR